MLGIWFTNACNLNCSYCYIKKKSNETIDVDLAVELICRELTPDEIPLGVMFMGAESLTHFDELKEQIEAYEKSTEKGEYEKNMEKLL